MVLALLILVAVLLAYLSYYLSYVACLAGFVVAKYGGGKREGKPGRVKSVVISWHKYRVHLHHWILASLTSLICAFKGFYIITPEFFYGFLGGLVLQGVYCYSDWHRIISLKTKLNPDHDG